MVSATEMRNWHLPEALRGLQAALESRDVAAIAEAEREVDGILQEICQNEEVEARCRRAAASMPDLGVRHESRW
jgi:hypothetical protein